jgi:hypothetical protein
VDMLINRIFAIGPLPTLNNFMNGLSIWPKLQSDVRFLQME